MTKDEVMQAIRLTAMGRAGHPLQEELAEKLAKVFAHECQALPVITVEVPSRFDEITVGAGLIPEKRTRKAKAE